MAEVMSVPAFEPCTRPTVVLRGYREMPDGSCEAFVFNPPCDSWECPVCRVRKARMLMSRALNAGLMPSLGAAIQNPYAYKLLTLTYGGKRDKKMTDNPFTQGFFCSLNNKQRKDWRLVHGPDTPLPMQYDASRRYTGSAGPDAAISLMAAAWNKLRTALRKYYGDFKYLRVVELHEDGYPHYHVLLAGDAIAPRGILAHITRLWSKYGLGFVKLNTLGPDGRFDGTVKGAVRYIIKYLFKAPADLVGKCRRYSAAKGALVPVVVRSVGRTFFRRLDYGVHNGIHAVKWSGDEVWDWMDQPVHWVSRPQEGMGYPLVDTTGIPF